MASGKPGAVHTPEFDYPKGKDNVYARYDGADGIPIGGIGWRFLFAWQNRPCRTSEWKATMQDIRRDPRGLIGHAELGTDESGSQFGGLS
jgi:hypothetical protein